MKFDVVSNWVTEAPGARVYTGIHKSSVSGLVWERPLEALTELMHEEVAIARLQNLSLQDVRTGTGWLYFWALP